MVFSIPSYLGVGDRYKRPIDERAKGATFLVSRPKTGHQPDALFDKEFKYMWNGDRRADAVTMARREQLESRKRHITSTGFLPTGPPPRGEGLGSYFGLIQRAPYPHMPDDPQSRAPPTQRRQPLPHQILTSPGKRGGYGCPGLALSDIGNAYIATVYDQPRIQARREREAWARRMPAVTFKPIGRRGYTFDEGPLTGTSMCYVMTAPFQPRRAVAGMKHFVVDKPWRPAGYVETKPTAMEYWEDPYGGFDPRVDPKSRVKRPSEQAFKPSSRTDDFWYTQSIVFKRF